MSTTQQPARFFDLGDVSLQSGGTLYAAKLAYQTYGELNQAKDNVVVLPTFYTGNHIRNEGFFGPDRAINPNKHFIISVNLFGNGFSTSPSNAHPKNAGAAFPLVTFFDNVFCQHRLLTEEFKIKEIALVAGWSMAACQSYQWAVQFPEMVRNILPFCGSAKTSIHNIVFLEGVKAALTADQNFQGGHYGEAPEAGLKAFGRVYAGWAFSQTFYREELFKELGFDTYEALLKDWEADHLNWDANDLLAMLATWQAGDISANQHFQGDFINALNSIKAKCITIPCSDDLYFPPEDNEFEVKHIKRGECRTFASPWGHCVASPGNCPAFHDYLDAAIIELLDT